MVRNLFDYLPPIIAELLEMQGVIISQQPLMDEAWDAVNEAYDDQFIVSATDRGLKRWESMLNLTRKGTDTLETRRFRVMSKSNDEIPYTLPGLRTKLETLCGGDYSCEIIPGTYILMVETHLTAFDSLNEISAMLERIDPANLVIELSNTLHFQAGGRAMVCGGVVNVETAVFSNDFIARPVINGAWRMAGGIVYSDSALVTNDRRETMLGVGRMNVGGGLMDTIKILITQEDE